MKKITPYLSLGLLLLGTIFCAKNTTLVTPTKTSAATPIDERYDSYYQLLVYSFADGNGDGVGDFKGIIDKLDYLDDLGITGIWLSPAHPSTTYHGYDVLDYYSIKPIYEPTIDGVKYDLDRLISECQSRDINLIMDLVMNHSANAHPWFLEGKEAFQNNGASKYKTWYNYSSTKTTRHPHNIDGVYYEGIFSGRMPDFNFDNPEVRQEFINIGKYWLNKGIHGFRMDATMHIYTKSYEGDKWSNDDTEKNKEWLLEFTTALKQDYPNTYVVCENWTDDRKIASYNGSIDSSFNFSTNGKIGNAINGTDRKGLPNYLRWFQTEIRNNNPDAIEAYFINNHDTGRNNYGSMVNSKMAGSLQILMPGNPFIYYGDELGMTGTSDGFADQGYRTPMPWESGRTVSTDYMNAGTTTKTISNNTADQDRNDPNSIFNHYKKILALKNSYPELYNGKLQPINITGSRMNSLVTYTMTKDNESSLVIHNMSSVSIDIELIGGTFALSGSVILNDGAPASLETNILKIPNKGTIVLKVLTNQGITLNANDGGYVIPESRVRVFMSTNDTAWLDSDQEPYAYVWGPDGRQATWPGVPMTSLGNNLYTFLVAGTTNISIIFSKEIDGTRLQTVDLTFNTGETVVPYFELRRITASDNKKYDATVSEYAALSPFVQNVQSLIEALTCDDYDSAIMAYEHYYALADNERTYLATLVIDENDGSTYLERLEYFYALTITTPVYTLTGDPSKGSSPLIIVLMVSALTLGLVLLGVLEYRKKRQH
ncbi:MAG: starch-binding protein [Erysipelotrichaceae bacterium]|jgi:glycosidase|nr:starch-binding protein [Erysipelotrichaceae bacterium]